MANNARREARSPLKDREMQVELSAGGAALDSGTKRRRQPQKGRSRVSNGSTLLPTGDGNSIWARLMRDTLAGLVVHLGGVVSETQRMACRRIAALEAELVHLEDGFARVRAAGGEPEAATVDLYQRISNTQRRLCESIGWQRTAREVVPTLQAYLAENYPRAAEGGAGESAVAAGTETAGDETRVSEATNESVRHAGAAAPAASGEVTRGTDPVSAATSPASSADGDGNG